VCPELETLAVRFVITLIETELQVSLTPIVTFHEQVIVALGLEWTAVNFMPRGVEIFLYDCRL